MLTDSEARALLREAATTIDVAPSGPIETSGRRPRWQALAAAAAVLVLVSGAAAVVARGSDGDRPDPAPSPSMTPDSVLQADQIPSVFGLSVQHAEAMLTDLGLEVQPSRYPDDIAQECGEPPGRAWRTEPPIGTRFEPGDPVTLVPSGVDMSGAYCIPQPRRQESYAFLDFAGSRGPGPTFADQVTLYVDGALTATLSADEAADQEAWGESSALTILERARQVVVPASDRGEFVTRTYGAYRGPFLTTRVGNPVDACRWGRVPAPPAGRQAWSIELSLITSDDCPAAVDLYETGGRIDTVIAYSAAPKPRSTNPGQLAVPKVVGIDEAAARAVLLDLGIDVSVDYKDRAGCLPDGVVLRQQPTAGEPAPHGDRVHLVVNRNQDDGCGGPPGPAAGERDRIGRLFVEFARGERDLPPVDTPVDLYLGNRFVKTISAEDSGVRSSYELCVPGGYAERSCPLSSIPLLAEGGDVELLADNPYELLSLLEPETPPQFRDRNAVTVAPTRDENRALLDTWAVQIGYNDVGQITAVNLLMGAP
ncbi:hypothetical protein NSZ01_24390 [Nocardioides szechwanensis]|uniref:PASTA domain-containing protein n=1 Tax=Nocardioides szechwanensis TaxID=1005944 RepID=A0A1H0EHU7_9ACTN|nr:PASTA domain-containing protein [Nocardioides szechwanensis]GEP34671.1 hypothetical protein NSZ01_24390 [Nocardioides szechwanensis]SDN81849.1 PASTA domain-containing protein [Nocardioides szechwanensis]